MAVPVAAARQADLRQSSKEKSFLVLFFQKRTESFRLFYKKEAKNFFLCDRRNAVSGFSAA
jgi:hypothetical protein